MQTIIRVARTLNRRFPGLPPLLILTDAARAPSAAFNLGHLPPGCAVIFRDYEAPDRAGRAAALRRQCRPNRIKLLIAGDPALALAVGADGVHWPEHQIPAAPRAWAPATRPHPDWLITAAAHSHAALVRAALAGADAALLSPVLATKSHPAARPLGPLRFTALTRAAALPVYALGGMTDATAQRLSASGAAGLAGIGFAKLASPSLTHSPWGYNRTAPSARDAGR